MSKISQFLLIRKKYLIITEIAKIVIIQILIVMEILITQLIQVTMIVFMKVIYLNAYIQKKVIHHYQYMKV